MIGVPAAYVLAKRQTALTRALEEMLVLPVAVPGLATALALIVTYGSLSGFRTSWAFILVGHVLFTLPFMVRSVLARQPTAAHGAALPPDKSVAAQAA